ncbi:hypothetical protein [Rugosimonospora africana]|uniref:Uncharacterized protein n=1 Tax=Rugosimonospora africana TaxID=556532 RepID=A0A8J3QPU2_9ACTN|nr:hypothetical protein [Rugosimonospora africana]GIH12936.1 hypothetical protein Raf01_11080 [Rugosimonospora africana]
MILQRRARIRLVLIVGAAVALVAGLTAVAVVIDRAAHDASPAAAALPDSTGVHSAGGVPSTSPSLSPSASSSAGLVSLAGAPAARGGSGARLRPVDGGAGYYGKFSPPLPGGSSFFPIGVWFESVLSQADTDKDADAGINTYVQLTDSTKMNLIRAAGMYAIQSDPKRAGAETVGWELPDEADMWAGPGDAPWTGKYPGGGEICQPASAKCGYTVDQTILGQYPQDNRLVYGNYGKGVTFWETNAQAARFVNQYPDVLSVDNYWLTDEGICIKNEGGSLFDPSKLVPDPNGGSDRLPAALCHRPANYGLTIDRVRSLVSPAGSKPVWAFIEVGHPNKDGDSTLSAQPQQIVAAVWSSIIHGARGIIYFNHSFGGPCKTQHALREPCYAAQRAAVKGVDAQVKALAPVLNAPFADNVARGTGVDVSTKWYGGHFYLLAGSTASGAQTARFTLPCVGNAQVSVLNENRTLTINQGTFSDRFADGNAVHIYRVDGGSSCGAY